MVDLSSLIQPQDIAILKDPCSCVGAHVSNQTLRIIYRLLRNAGHTVPVARRCRFWHYAGIQSLIDIADYPNRLNQNERGE